MTRATIHEAIKFEGLIEGCADYQWLLTDALYESCEEPPPDGSPRWVVECKLVEPADPQASDGFQNHFVARDLEKGWTVSAHSASALARRMSRRCSNSSS
jgi:hypothetical protein